MKRLVAFLLFSALAFGQQIDINQRTKGILAPNRMISGSITPNGCLVSSSDGTQINSAACPGSFSVKVNGVPLSSSTVLNLANSASVTFSDAGSGTVQATSSGGGGGSTLTNMFLTSTGEIGSFGNIMSGGISGAISSNKVVVLIANQVWLSVLNVTQPISVSRVAMGAGAAGSGTITVGIYSVSGNTLTKVIDSGTFTANSGFQKKNFTLVTLQPGVYYFAQTASNATSTAYGYQSGGTWGGFLEQLFTLGSSMAPPFGTLAQETASAGVLPATINLSNVSFDPTETTQCMVAAVFTYN